MLLKASYNLYKGKSGLISATKNNFYFINENKKLIKDTGIGIRIEFEPLQLIVQENTVLVFDSDNRALFFNDDFESISDWNFADDEKVIRNQSLLSDRLFFRKEISLLEVKFGFYDKKSKKKEIYDNFYPKFFHHSCIFGCTENSIYRYVECEKEWIEDISALGTYINQWQEEKTHQVKKFIGVWNEQLVVQLTGGRFIGLSLKTGELLWNINEVKNNETKQEIDFGFSDPYNPFLDEKTGHIYMLQGEVLIDFDLTKLEATYTWSIRDLELETYPFIRQSRMYDGRIYFTARSSINNDDDMVGVFDLQEKRIVWQHIFEFDKGTFIPNSQENILANNKNLLVLDNKGLLYIFEK